MQINLDGPENIHLIDSNYTSITKPDGGGDHEFNISDGETFESLTCTATCHPNCTYIWTKDGTIFNTSGATLDLGVVHKPSAGIYNCTAFGLNNQQESLVVVVNVKCE